MDFRWNDGNEDHATKHGVSKAEAEHVVRWARRPYPRRHDAGKWIVVGRGNGGREIQVIFVYDDDARVFIYIVHATPTRGHRRRNR